MKILHHIPTDSWIGKYLKYTQNQESPKRFHVWSAISTLSSTMARRCYINRVYYQTFPNQYIIMVAESALCRKSTAINIATSDILNAAGVADIIRQKMTTEFLCSYLANPLKPDNAITIFISELATGLGSTAMATGLIPLLTNLYDSPAKEEYRTKGSGDFKLINVCINLLGATTLDWLSTSLQFENVEGGFTGRVLFIVADENDRRIPWPTVDKSLIDIRTSLIDWLVKLAAISGEFDITKEARDIYADWYNNIQEPEDTRLRGFYGRKGEHLLKVAMCISVSMSFELVITAEHMKLSILLLDDIEAQMPKAYSGVVQSKTSKDIEKIMSVLAKKPTIAHSELLKRCYRYFNAKEFADAMQTLKEGGSVKEYMEGNKRFYQLVQ